MMKYIIGVFGILGLLLTLPATAEECGNDGDEPDSKVCQEPLTSDDAWSSADDYGYCCLDAQDNCTQLTDKQQTKNGFDSKPKVGTKAHCPVMEADFEVMENTSYSVYKGKYYAFCCPPCKDKFDENPEKYI